MIIFSRISPFLTHLFFSLFVFVCLSTGFERPAIAEEKAVLITPTRVLFEGRTRTATVRLINPNSYEQAYKISLVTIRMDAYGNKKEVATPTETEQAVQSMIRYSPRRATIPPDGWQTIRLMVRKPQDLPEGEYRTQLKVEPLPREKKIQQADSDRISIKIDIVFHVSIPVIIRHGQTRAEVIPRMPELVDRNGKPFLETRLDRKGNASIFADVKAFLAPGTDNGSRTLISEIKGISIYTQNDHQVIYLPVDSPDPLAGRSLDIEITSRETEEPRVIGHGRFSLAVD